MADIALAYSNHPIDSGTSYNSDYAAVLGAYTPDGAGTGYQFSFTPLSFTLPDIVTTKVTGTTLRGRYSEKILHRRREFHITIDSTELIPNASLAPYESLLGFLEDLYLAAHRYLVIFTAAPFADNNYITAIKNTYVEVFTKGDAFPVEWIEDCLYLPEVKLHLISREPF